MTEINNNEIRETRSNGIFGKVLMGGALVAALGGWWYQTNQVSAVREQLAGTEQKMEKLSGQLDTTVAMAKAEINESIAKTNADLEKARKDAQSSAARAQWAAKQQNGQLLTTLNAKNKELAEQLETIKKDSEEKSTKVDESLTGIKGEVGEVKTEVANAKTEIEKTIAELKRVNGDMGVMSGLIATNASELTALRQLGERDYFEFTIAKNQTQRVGDIQLGLKKADMKRNRFTLDVVADDRKVEKKDKGVNEPVQFYTSAARIPYEVVVNQVTKDRVTGYLSVPKVKIAAKR